MLFTVHGTQGPRCHPCVSQTNCDGQSQPNQTIHTLKNTSSKSWTFGLLGTLDPPVPPPSALCSIQLHLAPSFLLLSLSLPLSLSLCGPSLSIGCNQAPLIILHEKCLCFALSRALALSLCIV
ncbi:hypothetical protein Mapa_001971 [Marchantia paleacea]|nr:hypothetical protein Mapa_001971 [Marchantia paleacea]